MSLNPSVSIIVPTYMDWDKLAKCLESLKKQSYPTDLFEIIIVNNDPANPPPANFELPPNACIIDEVKPGSYAARNTALKIANGSIIGFTDSDCIPDKNWIKNAVDFINMNKEYNRVAGPVKIIQKSSRSTVIEKYNELYAFPQKWLIRNGGGSVTANLFVCKQVFEDIGGFDESLMSMGDKFWGMKAQAAGYKIAYLEDVSVLHPPRSLSELIKKEKRHGGAVILSKNHSKIKYILDYLFEFRPRVSSVRFMLGPNKRLKDRITIPLLRYFLLVVRAHERLKVKLGKKANRI